MARKRGTIGGFPELWESHENLYHGIFKKALGALNVNSEQKKKENAISKVLAVQLREECFRHEQSPRIPKWELPIHPELTETSEEDKDPARPDFTCSLVNSFATTPETYELPLHVECKRIGPSSSSWNLNRNYYENGVKRFDSARHKYGKSVPSGFMIGYVIASPPIRFLDEVNNFLPTDLNQLSFSFTEKLSEDVSTLHRKCIQPTPFKLTHMWVLLFDS